MEKLLLNKTAIITGAGRGIGRAIAEQMAHNGARVYAIDILDDELKWCKQKSTYNHAITPIALDICNFKAVKEMVMTTQKETGHIDILVNNAGLISYEMMTMIDYEFFRKMIEVNVVSLIFIMQLVSRIMTKVQSGSIINIASMVGKKGAKGQLSYSATKGAVISATLSAAKELAGSNIRVNAIAPGMVASERFRKVMSEKFSDKINDIPFGRLATPSDIANACLFLASDMSSYITGQVLGVDGGAII